jgi:tripartite ATP-independent transporter DctP family solute receptor
VLWACTLAARRRGKGGGTGPCEDGAINPGENPNMQAMGSMCAAAIAAVMSLTSLAQAEPLVLRIGSPFSPDHSSSKAVEIFRTELVRRTKGAVDVEFFPDMKLGGAKELIDGLRTDKIFAVPSPIPYLSRLVPETEALSLPFLFKDANHARRAVDGAIGKIIEARLAAKGFVPLGWFALGARHVTNAKRPLTTLDDFKGLKIRVQPSETHMATFRALGANPVAMDIKDVYTALKQGDIDAQENPYEPIYGTKFYEVQKYLSDTGHVFDLILFLASKKTFTDLPPEQQKAIRDAARIATIEQWKIADAVDEAAFASLKASGMQFDPIPAATRVELKKAMSGVIAGARQRLGAALVDQVVAAGRR